MFKGKYLKDIPPDFQWQKTPLQTYPLSFLRNHFILPLPLIQTSYNFLFYIKEGSFMNLINNKLYYCGPGSLVFVSAGTINALQKTSDDLKGYFVLIEEKIMTVLFNQSELLNVFMIDPVLKLKEIESEWMYTICKLLFTELSSKYPNIQISSSLTQALLNKIMQLSEKQRTITRSQQIAINFKKLVHQHYIKEKKLSFYTDSLAVSANYLNRCVKMVFHKSCKEIIAEVSVLNSQILLLDKTKTIAEISFQLNFEDPSYFTRIFKNFTGITPTEYRIKNMHDLS
jgi:AraC-like DNA-binding protein